MEPGEYLHHVVDFLLHFRQRLLLLDLLLQVEDAPAEYKIFLLVPLSEPLIINLNHLELQLNLLLRILVRELHLSQQQLRLVIVLKLVVISQGHITHNFYC